VIGDDTSAKSTFLYEYNNAFELQRIVRENRRKTDDFQSVSRDTTLYTWQGGNITREDEILFNGSIRTYSLYDYAPGSSGIQANFSHPRGLQIWRYSNETVYTSNFVTKITHYNPSSGDVDSTVNIPIFDSGNKLTSVKSSFYHPAGGFLASGTYHYTYQCK
jgi:hypothetical protein